MASTIYSLDNPLFKSYMFYVAVLSLKMVLVQFATIYARLTRKILCTVSLYLVLYINASVGLSKKIYYSESIRQLNLKSGDHVFANEEDVRSFSSGDSKLKINMAHPLVERIRRALLNDMENIFPFVLLGLLYIGTDPVYTTGILCFRVFTGARLLHTIVYLGQIPQPSRAIMFGIGLTVNVYMASAIILRTM